MKDDIKNIINRMTILDRIKKEISDLNGMYPMDISVEMELGDIVHKSDFLERINNRFHVELEKDMLTKTMSVLDLCILIENKKN